MCIYGDMNTFRPFLYFHEFDVLLTTDRPFTMYDGYDLHLHGVVILCLLFNLHNFSWKPTLDVIRKCGWREARLNRDPDAYKNVQLSVEKDGVESRKKRNPNIGPPPIPAKKKKHDIV